jgi:hypothetical protein
MYDGYQINMGSNLPNLAIPVYDGDITTAVPEPGIWALMLAGAAWMAWRRRVSSSA